MRPLRKFPRSNILDANLYGYCQLFGMRQRIFQKTWYVFESCRGEYLDKDNYNKVRFSLWEVRVREKIKYYKDGAVKFRITAIMSDGKMSATLDY